MLKPKGEWNVWLAGAGLATAILMTLGLLLVIFVNGVRAFWPHEIEQFQVQKPDGTSQLIWGSVSAERIRKQTDGTEIPELQIYNAGREVFGQSFCYVDVAAIKQRTAMPELMVLERMENGDAIVQPQALVLADGKRIAADSPQFKSEFAARIKRAGELRSQIKRIQKYDIGSINARMKEFGYEEKKIAAAPKQAQSQQQLDDIAAEKQQLQQQFEQLVQQAATLESELKAAKLEYRMAQQQQDASQHLGELVAFAYPNQMGFFGKLGHMLGQMWNFLWDDPREANTDGGIFPAIFGTALMTIIMSMLVTPLGVIAALYLHEYAKQGAVVRLVRICVSNLAGVPSIVFGVFGLGFFVYVVGGSIDRMFYEHMAPEAKFGTPGILWASLTLSLMTLPVVIVATEEALSAIPRGLREAALACGASKWQMIQRILLPGALPGILTGLILAMARGAGEVAPLMLTGVVKLAPALPLDFDGPFIHLERKFMHLGFHIFDLGYQAPDSEAAKPMVFATALLLIVMVLVMNFSAILIRNRIRRKLQSAAF